MTAVVVLALMTATCIQAAAVLSNARWPRRAPAAAIVLWQALGLGWGLAAVGTLIGLGAAGQASGVAGGAMNDLHGLAAGRLGFGPMAAVRLACLVAGLVLLTLLVGVLL